MDVFAVGSDIFDIASLSLSVSLCCSCIFFSFYVLTCGNYLYDIKYIEGYPLILGTAGNATVIELTAVATIGADASSIVLTVRTLFFFSLKKKQTNKRGH